jgi:hypothetical protein
VDAEPEDVVASREVPLEVRRTDRNFLYGRPFLEHVAARVLEFVKSDRGEEIDAWNDRTDLHDRIIDVHRQWLMTPHPQLNGAIPRTLVHGGADWIERLGRSQSRRAADQQGLIALPVEFSNYEVAPMGREEMAAYSELCRELMGAAWEWAWRTFSQRRRVVIPQHVEQLVGYLQGRADQWMQSERDGDPPAALIIECSRRRIPLISGVPVQGMTRPELHGSVADCDCPICRWQADQVAGGTLSGFGWLDGESHWMEFDEEFAFSMYEKREDWEENRLGMGYDDDWSADEPSEIDVQPRGRAVPDKYPADRCPEEKDPFAPIWSGASQDFQLPDDFAGQLGLTFLMAQLVSELKARHASSTEIRELNERFAERRRVRAGGGGGRTDFGDFLEGLASQYPDLIPRLADLQSRI